MAPSCLLTVSKSSRKQLCLTRLRKSSHCHELKPSSVNLCVLVCQFKNVEPWYLRVVRLSRAGRNLSEKIFSRKVLVGSLLSPKVRHEWERACSFFSPHKREEDYFSNHRPQRARHDHSTLSPRDTDCPQGLVRVFVLSSSPLGSQIPIQGLIRQQSYQYLPKVLYKIIGTGWAPSLNGY